MRDKGSLSSKRSFSVIESIVSRPEIESISCKYIAAIDGTTVDNAWEDLQGRSWKVTRNYILDGKKTDYGKKHGLSEHFEPLLSAAQQVASEATGQKLVADQVFATLYDSACVADNGSNFYEHRDYDMQGRLLFTSVIVQGYTPDGGDDEGVFGKLDCREPDTMDEATVALHAGDALLLKQTWHCPHAITTGRRLVFIFFFHRADRPGGSIVGMEDPAASAELEKQQDDDDWSNYLIFHIGGKELEDELGEDTLDSRHMSP